MSDYVPIEEALIAWAGTLQLDGWEHSDELPPDLTGGIHTRWTRTGGPSYHRVDYPQVQALTVAADRLVSGRAAAHLHGLVEREMHGQVIDTETGSVALAWRRTVSAPVWLDYGNPAAQAHLAVYDLVAHHQG